MTSFTAIDFETADYGPDSACAVGLVRVEEGRIVDELHLLIRPPRREFVFTYVHGLRWDDVAGEPAFAECWPRMAPFLTGAGRVVAHNAPFDRGVLKACCAAAGIEPPPLRFACTVRLARTAWNIRPTTLPNVCRHLNIGLRHHDAASDARACAMIALAALRDGVALR